MNYALQAIIWVAGLAGLGMGLGTAIKKLREGRK